MIASKDEFIALIKKDRILSGLDVAKYILSEVSDCTHLKLQKLLYLCYADYLCKTQGQKRLFTDKIYAYIYGPVIDSVYKQYKGKYTISVGVENPIPERKYKLAARSRILFSEDGLVKIQSILETLDKYKGFSAGKLIDITHKDGSPWSYYDSQKLNQIISDHVILQYHCNETF